MQTCGYCGRENEEGARNCRECGSELAGGGERRSPGKSKSDSTPARRLDLSKVEGAFTKHDGFSRPEWLVIFQALRGYHTPEERAEAWTDVVSQWAGRWEMELGEDYWLTSSGQFFLVSALDGETAERVLHQANWMAEKIKGVLGSLAWEDRPCFLTVQVADETLARRFDEAVAAPPVEGAERTAAERAPGWTLIGSTEETVMVHDIRPALTWDCLAGRPLPRWLQCGFATQLARMLDAANGRRPGELFDADRIPEHRQFWNETTIQSFWSGWGPSEYPEQAALFYELGNILVQLLTEKAKSLVDYLRCANYSDGGQSAALACLKIDLGELAGTFLGPGHWTPDVVAIVESWDRVQ